MENIKGRKKLQSPHERIQPTWQHNHRTQRWTAYTSKDHQLQKVQTAVIEDSSSVEEYRVSKTQKSCTTVSTMSHIAEVDKSLK